MLLSLSIYEDKHDPEKEDKVIHVCITHAAGQKPNELPDQESIYDLTVIQRGEPSWDDLFGEAERMINDKGGQEGHLVASANTSPEDGARLFLVQWDSRTEGTLKETVRPSDAQCGCTIF